MSTSVILSESKILYFVWPKSVFSLQESSAKDLIKSLEESHSQMKTSLPEDNPDLHRLLGDWGLLEDEALRNSLVLTDYHAVEKLTNGLAIKW